MKARNCVESDKGRTYMGLRHAEVIALATILFEVLKPIPAIEDFRRPNVDDAIRLNVVADGFNRLVDDDDITLNEVGGIVGIGEEHGVKIPACLVNPSRTEEKFRGVNPHEERHLLRQYKYSRWIIEHAAKLGVDIAKCYAISTPVTYWIGEYESIAWYELEKEPQIPAMAKVLAKNLAAEAAKRNRTNAIPKEQRELILNGEAERIAAERSVPDELQRLHKIIHEQQRRLVYLEERERQRRTEHLQNQRAAGTGYRLVSGAEPELQRHLFALQRELKYVRGFRNVKARDAVDRVIEALKQSVYSGAREAA